MRISSALLVPLALAACGEQRTDHTTLAKVKAAPRAAQDPSGAFHRLLVTRDGRGVIAADGAEKAVVTVIGTGKIEVALGGDGYRLPATVKGARKAS